MRETPKQSGLGDVRLRPCAAIHSLLSMAIGAPWNRVPSTEHIFMETPDFGGLIVMTLRGSAESSCILDKKKKFLKLKTSCASTAKIADDCDDLPDFSSVCGKAGEVRLM